MLRVLISEAFTSVHRYKNEQARSLAVIFSYAVLYREPVVWPNILLLLVRLAHWKIDTDYGRSLPSKSLKPHARPHRTDFEVRRSSLVAT
jgi:hypothetical protein